MEQKDYKLEIVNELLKGSSHIRGLAKRLGTNHMNVLRKIGMLSHENVVDYEQQGKNKMYFLKKTAEAKSYAFMTENYRLSQTIKRYPNLRQIVENIQKNSKIRLAIIFGSYAKGTARSGSDIDIFIENKGMDIKKDVEMISTKLSIKTGRYDSSSLLIKEIEKNHVIIKGIERYYEKNKFFE